ncbi:FRG domain-containing protein [Pectobacterium polonicum]|uniref:FRG domain-containing protein n=1 Tax=Pectobacterium polonicum TaxID=2485124 RepID=A0ABV1PAR3_9GAMM|nr:FRG domain-containing protein [Pectobacterium polonicum]MDC9821993.1 FRG domain-containing protein [Pectobacterium polonicum]
MTTQNEPIKSVAQFIDFVMTWNDKGSTPVAFRGQKFSEWSVEPKIFRDDVGLYEKEDDSIREIISIHPSEFESDNSMFDKLVRAQHFGLPTRLLDVTINPLVALWFATEEKTNENENDGAVFAFYVPESRKKYYDSDRVSCLANLAYLKIKDKNEIYNSLIENIKREQFNKKEAVKRLVYSVGMEKPHFKAKVIPSDLMKAVYVKPKMSNKRIVAQSGSFMLYGYKPNNFYSDEEPVRVKKIIIEEGYKFKIRYELNKIGISESTLFPEIDKAAKFIADYFSSNI